MQTGEPVLPVLHSHILVYYTEYEFGTREGSSAVTISPKPKRAQHVFHSVELRNQTILLPTDMMQVKNPRVVFLHTEIDYPGSF